MPIDDRTANFDLPLPNKDNLLIDDVERLRGAITGIDNELGDLNGTQVTAGNGLAGGGSLSGNVNVELGTPSTLSTTSLNETTAESHSHAVTFPVTSVNSKTGDVALTTDDVGEGANLYHTNARAAAAAPVQSVAGKTGAVTLTPSDAGAQPAMLQASQAEMEAGTEAAIRSMSPINIKQAIDAQVADLGSGGAVASGSVVLTENSAAVQFITSTNYGQSVTLPDATTMVKGLPSFAIKNAGPHDLGIMDSAGNRLGWIRSYQTGIIGLVDNSTVSGVWVTSGVEKLGLTASKVIYSLTGMSSSFGMKAVAVDQNRALILFGTTVLNAIVYDANTLSFGQPTVVIASIKSGLIEGILVSTDKILALGATDNDLHGVVLSLSGTAITVGSPGTRSTNIPDKMGMLVQLGNSGTTFAFTQGRSSGPYAEICAISINNDTVTIGDTLQLDCPTDSKSGLVLVPISESTVLALNGNSVNISAKIHSISGATVTPGSAALLTTNKSEFRWLVLPSGRVVIIYTDLNKTHGAIISVTGMTVSASDVVLGDYNGGTAPFLLSSIAAVAESGKILVVNNADSGFLSANILTDSSGVAGAETASVIHSPGGSGGFNIVSVNGDVISLSIGNDNVCALINVDVSGVTPVMDIVDTFYSTLNRQYFVAQAVDNDQFNYRINSLGNGSAKYAPNLIGAGVSLGYTSKRIFKIDSPNLKAMGWATNLFGVAPDGSDLWAVSSSGAASAIISRLEAAE